MTDVHELFKPFDDAVDTIFSPLRGLPMANRILFGASNVADHSILWFTLSAVRGLRKGGERYAVRAAAALLAESILVNLGIKTIFGRSRPTWEGDLPHEIRTPLTSSFPSGHASAAACAAVLLSDNDRLWPVYVGLAALVAPSRIHVRMHHASDVVAGLAIGTAFGLLVKKIFPIDSRAERH